MKFYDLKVLKLSMEPSKSIYILIDRSHRFNEF